jgi:predicted HicB family RNase H-like nuclease
MDKPSVPPVTRPSRGKAVPKNLINQSTLGPYKGYAGIANYDAETGIFHGEVTGTNEDVVTFQARRVEELGDAFADSVDDYLDFLAGT